MTVREISKKKITSAFILQSILALGLAAFSCCCWSIRIRGGSPATWRMTTVTRFFFRKRYRRTLQPVYDRLWRKPLLEHLAGGSFRNLWHQEHSHPAHVPYHVMGCRFDLGHERGQKTSECRLVNCDDGFSGIIHCVFYAHSSPEFISNRVLAFFDEHSLCARCIWDFAHRVPFGSSLTRLGRRHCPEALM